VGRGSRPDGRRRWYSTFAPFPDTCPRNQPALGQTYATVVFGEGRVSGEQMLTVGRGLRMTAPAAVHKAAFQVTHCQESVRLQAVAAANNMSVVSTSLMSTSQLCDIRSQGRARSERYKNGEQLTLCAFAAGVRLRLGARCSSLQVTLDGLM